MVFPSGLGVVLSLVFGFLLLALIAELYYLLWWKRLKPTNNNNDNDNKHSSLSLPYYFLSCLKHPPPPQQHTHTTTTITCTTTTTTNNLRTTPQLPTTTVNTDLEIGASKEFLLRAFEGTESHDELDVGIETELMRLHNLTGPPRFLFTIKEETKEDLVESDADGGGRTRKAANSLGELIHTNPFANQSPLQLSPPLKKISTKTTASDDEVALECYSRHGINPLFESVWVDEELDRLRASPPPKFKFLREAEEKLYKRLLVEAEKINCKQSSELRNSVVDEGLVKKIIVNKNSNHHHHQHQHQHQHHTQIQHSSCSQVLPLSSSPTSSRFNTGGDDGDGGGMSKHGDDD